ncbi:hypothetical protein GCM10011571_09580 [Marinithermofilum abyssi]|uniref:Alkaline shock response membrane anchor protein AmaP n=1 Tax=Marinithermofilum abyssi TaxID=1571185 RepID=A0A8J2YC12_9BACL|nr:alkaline shock response membrane anchor protein AmaP [Marinithermofilum abyssi]GGE10358.1 hypothetical protein GCM10011571_09580 [Marinithermofilum abyssi]
MGMMNRVYLTVFSLAVGAFSIAGIMMGLNAGVGNEAVLTDLLHQYYRDSGAQWSLALISTLVLVASLQSLFGVIRRRQEDPGVDRLTEFGHIRISLKTLENLSVKAARRVKGIRDLTARVRHDGSNSSVGIGLKLTVDGETPIQTLSEQLQETVKHYLEEVAGVDVNQISVYIADTVQPNRSRVRVE